MKIKASKLFSDIKVLLGISLGIVTWPIPLTAVVLYDVFGFLGRYVEHDADTETYSDYLDGLENYVGNFFGALFLTWVVILTLMGW